MSISEYTLTDPGSEFWCSFAETDICDTRVWCCHSCVTSLLRVTQFFCHPKCLMARDYVSVSIWLVFWNLSAGHRVDAGQMGHIWDL